jgi:thiamine transport system permease protein
MSAAASLPGSRIRRTADGRVIAGCAALGAVGLLVGGAFAGLALEAWHDPGRALAAFDPYLVRVARFTLWQAALSTLVSVVPALLVARALARHADFPGRTLLLRLFALPLALPAIVAALGILALLGRAGIVSPMLSWLRDGPWPGIYGLSGILVAHAFFNLPLATRLFLGALETIPDDQRRLAAQLGMGGWASFRFVEWPVLRASLPGVAGLVFMLCITSFTIVLTLGGGPRATTLEVAIYQALRFDFDPARAVALTALQLVLTALVLWLLARTGAGVAADAAFSVSRRRSVPSPRQGRAFDAAIILLALLFVAAPLAAVAIAGLRADLGRLAADPEVHAATLTSLVLAVLAAALSLCLSLALVAARRRLEIRRGNAAPGILERMTGTGAAFVLVIPPIVIGAGWFILLRGTGSVLALAPVMVVTVNAIMAMPFVIRVLRPAHDTASVRHERLCASLGIAGLTRLRIVDWPSLRAPIATAFAFAMALSLGDLGVIALFGSDSVRTLPYLLLSRMGSYRTEDAAGLALMLGMLCLALMLLADRRGRKTQ